MALRVLWVMSGILGGRLSLGAWRAREWHDTLRRTGKKQRYSIRVHLLDLSRLVHIIATSATVLVPFAFFTLLLSTSRVDQVPSALV